MIMTEAQKPVKATPLQVAKAVFWSFFGIRKRAEYEKDAVSLTLRRWSSPASSARLILVLSLVTLVHFITR